MADCLDAARGENADLLGHRGPEKPVQDRRITGHRRGVAPVINGQLDWHGEEAKRFVFAAAWEGLVRATVLLFNLVQAALNIANPRPYKNSSKVGEPPHKRTGWGAAHVEPDFDERNLATRVALMPDAKYMLMHEL